MDRSPQTIGLGVSRYRLEVRPSVEKTLRKIRDLKLQRRLDEALTKLAENPRRMGAEKMAGFEIVIASALGIIESSTKFVTPFYWYWFWPSAIVKRFIVEQVTRR